MHCPNAPATFIHLLNLLWPFPFSFVKQGMRVRQHGCKQVLPSPVNRIFKNEYRDAHVVLDFKVGK
ncbi:hypothetical protein J2S03_001335 [Alicyclobacillus cycloheptanicus]|uniref:Uncharacterized protein n=1 Tax=Alicyclobacillus cycloheptanicus TaxID=1457 RepID=A0ABT9XGS3_9BACL|nr:hypothetical protein [Alicyclobacillus cycloheptanicus]